LAVALDRVGAAGNLVLFPLAAAALIPLAWLIGEATEQAARYTGAGVGGFSTRGNAPELIVALVALSDGLTDVVRASLAGSVIGNLLLVLGFVMLVGDRGTIDRISAFVSLGSVLLAIDPLALSLRPIELVGMGGAVLVVATAVSPARTSRTAGALLIGAYVALVVAFYFAGDR
jgi:Ca2+/H+ antiporter